MRKVTLITSIIALLDQDFPSTQVNLKLALLCHCACGCIETKINRLIISFSK